MANYNKVLLMGRLTRDPQLSYTPNQTAIVDFGLAINRKWKGQDGSERDETCFVDCTMFGRRAEVINKYCKKGNPLFVEGRLTFDSWQAQDGSNRSKLKVTVESFEFLGGGGGASGGGGGQAGQSYGGGAPAPAPAPGQRPVGDDDIPF
ncbi:MAG: single-stranded DNA-binding protein [Planctomycetota bacterium]|jgi:single-strand DNA-binding protein